MKGDLDSIQDQETGLSVRMKVWLLVLSEFLLFTGLFLLFTLYFVSNSEAFRMAAEDLYHSAGVINTAILLLSSMTMAMSHTALKKMQKGTSVFLLQVTIMLGLVFIITRYFEWGVSFENGIWPGSDYLNNHTGIGENLFYNLYFIITGLHSLLIITGIVLTGMTISKLLNDNLKSDKSQILENTGLYWHILVAIWLIIYTLFYLIA